MSDILTINSPLLRWEKPIRDPWYKRFIRRLPCLCCGRAWGIEAAHFGPHGVGQKASDLHTLPLCHLCHRLYHKLGPVRFAEVHRLDVWGTIAKLNQFYREKLAA
jgi:hypothetical protein